MARILYKFSGEELDLPFIVIDWARRAHSGSREDNTSRGSESSETFKAGECDRSYGRPACGA